MQTRMSGPDVVVMAYKATFDQTMNGKKNPSPVYMTSVWHRIGGKWVPVSHSETSAAPSPANSK
jgi:hypothetical protein